MSVEQGNNIINDLQIDGKRIEYVIQGSDIIYPYNPELWTKSGKHKTILFAGAYEIIVRGGGGSGGNDGAPLYYAAGVGGAGAKGDIFAKIVNITEPVEAEIFVGSAGLTYAYGGNGGDNNDAYGAGGGGAKPSYVIINDIIVSADGGGGGGGGGDGGILARNAGSGDGGCGGGFYRLETQYSAQNGWTINIVSVDGQKGSSGDAVAGIAGNTTDFQNIYSGIGGVGSNGHGPASNANGGGASGASGGRGHNSSSARSGGGGGGAGGSEDAGGGTGGSSYPTYRNGGDAYNPHTTPTDTIVENAAYGINGSYGIGGTTATNGTSGFVCIRRGESVSSIMDLGNITDAPETMYDAGLIIDVATETINCNNII